MLERAVTPLQSCQMDISFGGEQRCCSRKEGGVILRFICKCVPYILRYRGMVFINCSYEGKDSERISRHYHYTTV